MTAGATQVKWNRKNQMTLASAHNGEVRIWDIRVRHILLDFSDSQLLLLPILSVDSMSLLALKVHPNQLYEVLFYLIYVLILSHSLRNE